MTIHVQKIIHVILILYIKHTSTISVFIVASDDIQNQNVVRSPIDCILSVCNIRETVIDGLDSSDIRKTS